MNEKTLKKVATRIDVELVKELERRAVDLDLSMQGMYDMVIREWLAGKGVKVAATSPYPERHREWHDKLECILKDDQQRIGIEWSLRWGYSSVTMGDQSYRPRLKKASNG